MGELGENFATTCQATPSPKMKTVVVINIDHLRLPGGRTRILEERFSAETELYQTHSPLRR